MGWKVRSLKPIATEEKFLLGQTAVLGRILAATCSRWPARPRLVARARGRPILFGPDLCIA